MTTREFIEKLAQDEALGKKLAACKTPEEAYAAAKEVGLTDTPDAFTAVMGEMYKRSKCELNDDELAQIAGGVPEAVAAVIPVAFFAAAAAAS